MATGRYLGSFALAALLALPACAAQSPPVVESGARAVAPAASEFAGSWGYRQSCGWQHSAHLELSASGAAVSGSWDDGTRNGGDSGRVSGALREGRLYLRFCSESVPAGKAGACPEFGPESAYLASEDGALSWYRKSGDSYQPYLKLHPAGDGRSVPDDTSGCEDAAAED